MLGFLVLLEQFAVGRDISAAWLALIGAMLGLPWVVDAQRRKDQGG